MNEIKKKHLLVVDDQIDLLTTLKFIFEDHGYDITMVSSGREALEKIKEMEFDLVLLDINMPEMDGLETFRGIKKISSNTAVIMMTGNKENVQIKKSLEEGAITVVYKPFAIQNLLELMSRVINKPVILVVDDRRDDRTLLRNSLEIKNFRVVEARDGMDAVDKMKSGKYDVCIVDFKMPGMNGVETIAKIKEINPEVGAILMSGTYLEDEIKTEVAGNSGLVFIRKPYEISKLVEMIAESMKKRTI